MILYQFRWPNVNTRGKSLPPRRPPALPSVPAHRALKVTLDDLRALAARVGGRDATISFIGDVQGRGRPGKQQRVTKVAWLGEGEMVTVPSSLEHLVRTSEVPLAVLEVPSGDVVLANDAAFQVLGTSPEALQRLPTVLELVVPDERTRAEAALQALADGTVSGYQAVRRFAVAQGHARELSVWLSAVELEGQRVALWSAASVRRGSVQFKPLAGPPASAPGSVVLGTLDREWQIDRVSYDVVEMLGYQPEEMVGLPFLGLVHPADAQDFLVAVGQAGIGRRSVHVSMRIRAKTGTWRRVTTVVATFTDDNPPAVAFAFVLPAGEDGAPDEPPGAGGAPLQVQLQRMDRDRQACAIVRRLHRLPDVAQLPALSQLTSREWEILVLVLEGERVPSIAEDLYLSQSTVRNHLSSVFSKLGVHSQSALIRLLRNL